MADIFTPWKMKNLDIANRLVRSATWEAMGEPDGTPAIDLANLLADLAEGQVGLIITGYAFVDPIGRGLPKQTGMHIDAMVGPWTRITEAVHRSGGKIAMQIVHAGGQTKADWIGGQPLGPSAMTHPAFGDQVAELSLEQIQKIIQQFGDSAARAKAAGFDAVELHAAHGYLINQFLSPNTNLRQDQYGGSLENRARFCMEVYDEARRAVGPDYPLFIKLNSEDALAGGLAFPDALYVARELDKRGIDAIEVSGGVPAAKENSPSRLVKEAGDEGYFLGNAQSIKAQVSCPIIVVGGWRSPGRIQEALDQVDAVAMSRPFIRQPHLARYWREGGQNPATCISCGQCFRVSMKDGLACGQELKKQE